MHWCCDICDSTELEYAPLILTEICEYNIVSRKYIDSLITKASRHLSSNMLWLCNNIWVYYECNQSSFLNIKGFVIPFLASFRFYTLNNRL